MQCITDINEIMRILERTSGEPVYKSIGTDEEGNEVAVPVFTIGEGNNRKKRPSKRR